MRHAARAARLPRRAARGRRRAGGDDRLLGLQQGRRATSPPAGRPTGRRSRIAEVLARARRRAGSSSTAAAARVGRGGGPTNVRDPRPAARHRRGAAEDDRAGRGAGGQVRGRRDRPPRARAAPAARCSCARSSGAAPIEPERAPRFDAVVERDGRALRRRLPRAWSTTTPSFVGVLPRRHAGRRDLAAAARLAAGAAPGGAAASTTCARSRGCSRGRRRGSCCRPGSGSAPRSRARARRHGLELLQRDGARLAVLRRRCSPTRRWRARRPTSRSPRATWSWATTRRARERIWGRDRGRVRAHLPRAAAVTRRGRACSTASRSLQASIDRRNPYVDPLSFVQVELLRRLRARRRDGDGEELGAGRACSRSTGSPAGCATPADAPYHTPQAARAGAGPRTTVPVCPSFRQNRCRASW